MVLCCVTNLKVNTRTLTLFQEMEKKSEKLDFVLRALRPRPNVEWILFAKVLIHTEQGHQLDKIGLSAKEIKAIDEEYCVKACNEDK